MEVDDDDNCRVNAFKQIFKHYKRKNVKLDLTCVYDFHKIEKNSDRFRKQIPNSSEYSDEIEKVQINYDLGIDWESSYGMMDPKEWTVFTLRLKPGLIYVKNPFKPHGQRYWIVRCLKDFTKKPNHLNIDALNILEEGVDWWEFCKREYDTKQGQITLEKMRWATLGYHHNWDTKEYSENLKTVFPVDLKVFCRDLANVFGFSKFSAEAAIINMYHRDSCLNGHIDHSEIDLEAPLFSISFGQSAIFLIGGKSLDEEPVAILIHSGDIILMSKEARLCYHGVPRIIDSNSKSWSIALDKEVKSVNNSALDKDTLKLIWDNDFWKPFDLYVNKSRINVNIRQVLLSSQTKLP